MYFEEAKQKFEKLKDKECVRVLAFESSCDETSVAVVEFVGAKPKGQASPLFGNCRTTSPALPKEL